MAVVTDRRVVVTGKITNESRQTAEQKLRDVGAIVDSSVSNKTDILVTGAGVGKTKLNKAIALGVDIIPWEQAFEERASGIAAVAPTPRAPLPTVKQWAPMLCLQADELPVGEDWIFELKWDGQRGIATVKDGAVVIQSRTGKTDLTERYPQIAEELSGLPNCVLDGELVDGKFIVFDMLVDEEIEGDIRTKPLKLRRQRLAGTLPNGQYVGISPQFEDGPTLLNYVQTEGLEGIVAKRLSSSYVENQRGPHWLKIKVRRQQEFVICGFTKGEGSRLSTFGALVLGYYDADGILTYAGKVGTGWNQRTLREVRDLMTLHVTGRSHLGWYPSDLGPTIWLTPVLVCEVAFQKWTEDGILWHPSFQRMREPGEKLARDVVRET